MITQHNFQADIDNRDALGIMIRLKPTREFEGGTALVLPGMQGPPVHYHPHQAEIFKVVQGELEVFRQDRWITVRQGQKLLVSKMIPHTFRNRTDQEVVFDFGVTPKMGFTAYLLTLDELVKVNKINGRKTLRSMLHYACLVMQYSAVICLAKPSKWVVALLAAIARLVGFSVSNEKFRAEHLRTVAIWGPEKVDSPVSEVVYDESLF